MAPIKYSRSHPRDGYCMAYDSSRNKVVLFGGWALFGIILASTLPKLSNKLLGTVSLSVNSLMGIGLAVIGVAPTMYLAVVAAFMMEIA